MNERRTNDPPADDPSVEAFAGPVTRSRLERARPTLLWLLPLLPILTIAAVALPYDTWRTPLDLLRSTDYRALLPGLMPALEPLSASVPRWACTALVAAAIGLLTWIWRARTAGFGFFALLLAVVLSVLAELVRWAKPGQLPDFRDPLIAAVVAPVVWFLARYLPVQPVTPLPRRGPWSIRLRILLGFAATGVLAGAIAVGAALGPAINAIGYPPAELGERLAELPAGRTGFSSLAASLISKPLVLSGVINWLETANTLHRADNLPYPGWVGASEANSGVLPAGRLRSVANIDEFRAVANNAEPGDVILMQPGTYRIKGGYITLNRPGTEDRPITVRAPKLGLVTVESELSEALKIAAPHWHFENLVLRGVCPADWACDNGFHIVGPAEDTVLRNMLIEDFNAQVKINGEDGNFPDRGRIEHSTLIETHARNTDAPVASIDLVGAADWVIEDSLIADFPKLAGNLVSYGAYAKGEARRTRFNRDVILCEWHLHGPRSDTVGLSFGGGGTGQGFMRDRGRSGYEHADGVMENNLIAFCSDDGVYLNRAANSVLRHNTLIGTTGIEVRFVESTARLDANVVDGAIRARDGGLFWGSGNDTGTLTGMFLARNPVRADFVDPGRLDLRWARLPTLDDPGHGTDLCGGEWAEPAPAGAFQDYRACTGTMPAAPSGGAK